MEKRQLGQSTLQISEIGLGCMSLPPAINEAKPILLEALQSGITYFDTADLYQFGHNETVIGEVLKNHRHQITLASKVGNKANAAKDGWTWDTSKAYIETAVRESLKRLQTDYLDVYQLHGGTLEDDFDEVIDTFEGLKKQGLIRSYGISTLRPNVLQTFLPLAQASTVMMPYSLLDREPEEFFPFIQQQGASVVSRGTLAKGLLTTAWEERLQAHTHYDEQALRQLLSQLTAQYGNLHALALAFNLRSPAVASTIIGASSVTQLQQTIKAYQVAQQIDDFAFAKEHTKLTTYTKHR